MPDGFTAIERQAITRVYLTATVGPSTYGTNDGTVKIDYENNQTYSYTCASQENAFKVWQLILTAVSGTNNVIYEPGLVYITGVQNADGTNSNIFNFGSDTLLINGVGFTPDNVGQITIDDADGSPNPPGGMNYSGVFLTCTYVSPTKLMATYVAGSFVAGDGDVAYNAGGVAPFVSYLFYSDANNIVQQNPIFYAISSGVAPTGDYITITAESQLGALIITQ